jgi:3-hydroxyacyl-CoA dehydrogenase
LLSAARHLEWAWRTAKEAATMERTIRRVLVLGANGTMGAQSAALFARAGFDVCCASRTAEKSAAAIAALVTKEPALESRLTATSYDDLPRLVAECDWIFEALGEDLDLKRGYFDIIDRHRRSDALVTTVTSGLSLERLGEGRSASFQEHFLGTHLYNPPAKLRACERIAHARTRSDVIAFVDAFLRDTLGRVVIPTRDVPAFAGNRIGFQFLNQAAKLAETHGVLAVDTLLGSHTGRALPPLATIDLVGLDVHRAIVDNVFHNAMQDCRPCFQLPEFMSAMIVGGQLGRKSAERGGFYGPRTNGAKPVWNPARNTHETPEAPRFDVVEEARALLREGRTADAVRGMFAAPGPEARVLQRALANYIHYAFARVGDVTEREHGIHGIDAVMAHGFYWAPPGAWVDFLGGPRAAADVLEANGFRVPEALAALPADAPVCAIERPEKFFGG